MLRLVALPMALVLALSTQSALAAEGQEIPIDVRRLSDRVVVLTDSTLGGNNVVALAARRGLVVVDTSGSPAIAARVRSEIEKAFGRTDFAYVINSHEDFDHVGGNQVFADATLVGHEHCRRALLGLRERSEAVKADRIAWQLNHVNQLRQRLEELDPASDEALEARRSIDRSERLLEVIAEGADFTPPTLTFDERMSLDLGDMTVNLVFFGSAHSRSDTLIHVPEEGLLMVGDLFSEAIPGFNVGEARTLDVPRCLSVLDALLSPQARVTRVVLGHRDLWDRETLEARYRCTRAVWDGVRQAYAQELGVDATLRSLPLDTVCPGPEGAGRLRTRLERQHTEMVTVFRRQLQTSAATAIEEALATGGVPAARAAYHQAKTDPAEASYVDEGQLNALGYRLLQAGRVGEAITIFALNADAFPESWNVWDSLGEAYLTSGDRVSSIASYRRSMQLNPDNQNGKAALERLASEDEAASRPTQ